MSLKYLLDTNVLSEPLTPAPDPNLMEKLRQRGGEIATAAPVWHELVFGCRRLPHSKKRAVIERYLREVIEGTVPILPYDAASAAWHGEERARLAKTGDTPPFVDGQIASIAQVNGLILVTRNTADFKRFEGVRVENWFGRPRLKSVR